MTESFADKAKAKLTQTTTGAPQPSEGLNFHPFAPLPVPPRLEIFRLDKRAKLPIRAHSSDIGWDIFAHILTEKGRDSTRAIPRYNSSAIETGLIIRPPPGYYCQICSRSGWALQGVFVANAPGIIDPTFVGELKIILYNGSYETKYISHGQRIGQLVLAPIVLAEPYEITEPPPSSDRGAAGFGSTGL